jgi:hypothetical protein
VNKVAGLLLLMIGVSGLAMGIDLPAPEIDPTSGMSALALLSGVLMMVRGRRRHNG